MTHLRVVPDPQVTWEEACAVAMFRTIRGPVRDAAHWIADNHGDDVAEAAISCTLAALADAGWLVIPERTDQ